MACRPLLVEVHRGLLRPAGKQHCQISHEEPISTIATLPDIMQDSTAVFWYILVAMPFPWLAVLLQRGCGADFIINIVLCSLFCFPGLPHAIWCICHGREERHHIYKRKTVRRDRRMAAGLEDNTMKVVAKWLLGFLGFVAADYAVGA